MNSKLTKSGLVSYPEYIDVVSQHLGPLRDLLNATLMADAKQYRRDGYNVNVLGVAGELLVQHICWSHGIAYRAAPIVDLQPVRDCDIIIGDNRIDVKASRKDAIALRVNCKAHHKDKNVTHYWFVQFLADRQARYWIFKKSDIDQWPIKKYLTEAYYYPISKLV